VVGDGRARAADDVRGLGALLYGALTAHWPLAPTGGAATLRPATTSSGHLLSPRQVRAGVPEDLSSLAVRALDQSSPQGVRSAAAMASALASRAGPADDVFGLADDTRERRPRSRWLRVGVPAATGIVVLALLGWVVGAALGGLPGVDGSKQTAAATEPTTSGPAPSTAALVAVKPESGSLYDPEGNGDEGDGIPAATDGDPATAWRTDRYKRNASFGNIKPGIGILYDFGKPVALRDVKVTTDVPGVQVEIRSGPTADAGPDGYAVVGTSATVPESGASFAIKAGTSARYYVVWMTRLSPDDRGTFWGSISEVTFRR
jgi:putative peptidoglycan lipid II flippase